MNAVSPRARRMVPAYAAFSACVVAAVWAVAAQRQAVIEALGAVRPFDVFVAAVFGALAVLALFRSWHDALRAGGTDLRPRDGLVIYGVGQLGKYLPGAVWPVVAQATMGGRLGISRLRMASGALLALAISVCVALVLGCVFLQFAGRDATDRLWWSSLLAVPFLVVLWPPLLNRAVTTAARVTGHSQPRASFTGAGICRSAAWCAVGNFLFGVHLFFLGRAVGMETFRDYLLAVAAYALASALGVLVVFTPAGVGVREVVLTVVLAPALSVGAALTVALLSRALLIVVDVALGLTQILRVEHLSKEDDSNRIGA